VGNYENVIYFEKMKKTIEFLKKIKQNNNREWFLENKSEYDIIIKDNKEKFSYFYEKLVEKDFVEKMHVFRIYRDVRFSKNKTPYKTNFGFAFERSKPLFRGHYYIHIEPGNSFVGGGFFDPTPEELLRIRKELELDTTEIYKITSDKTFVKYFGKLEGENGVKTAPKGFDKNHPAIDLIRKKQYVVMRKFSDNEICSADFTKEVITTFGALRPFFDYMSEILTTDLNGELIV